ncbi:MAG: nuclear transport factor 2 family protein [Crocinitomicaceae bacterium]|nr:nuclear transport factor 2 family protein [Crocinitomicaceae bacterium]
MMKTIKFGLAGILSFFCLITNAQVENSQSEISQITETLMKYIDGTANGELNKLKEAFHPDFNLYSVTKEDSLRVWSGKEYIEGIEEGQKTNRIGKIISIDYEKDAAIAKAEILIPNWRIFTDYFLLVKYEGSWKIVHKSYTWREVTTSDEKQ